MSEVANSLLASTLTVMARPAKATAAFHFKIRGLGVGNQHLSLYVVIIKENFELQRITFAWISFWVAVARPAQAAEPVRTKCHGISRFVSEPAANASLAFHQASRYVSLLSRIRANTAEQPS